MDPMEDATTRTLVRANDRSTSWEAAAAQTPKRRQYVMRRIMEHLERAPEGMTDADLEAALGPRTFALIPGSSLRTRRRELEEAGWVTPMLTDDGAVLKRRRTGPTGSMPQVVWRRVGDDEEPPPVRPTAAQERRERERAAEHEAGLEAARRWASWHLGVEAYWADALVEAYLDPAAAQARLDEEMGA